MLHRAASNACSWWWASHIRTKQSKWLQSNLQEMEEKVKYMTKLISEDGDSFAKRAESYYRKRPEILSFVEEFYRAYRSLADRYDHISGELHNANHTIATVFPDQVPYAMDEDEEDGSPKAPPRKLDPSRLPKNMPPKAPEIPKAHVQKFVNNLKIKGSLRKPPKEMQPEKTDKPKPVCSQMSKDESLKDIDKLQKGILALQTEKEFVKSSYESRLTKYWDIEKEITEMQEKVCKLQDEFSIGSVIEDNEARTLMASTALKSCLDTLEQLQEKQERSTKEARKEYERFKEAQNKLEVLKGEFLQNQTDRNVSEKEHVSESTTMKLEDLQKDILDVESIREKIKEQLEMNSDASLTVPELAEKIDELVTKVIRLESAVSTQTALITRLRSETDNLHGNLQNLEEDKATLLQDTRTLTEKLREVEGELRAVQNLNKNAAEENSNLQTHIAEANCSVDHLTEKLKSAKPVDDESTGSQEAELGKPCDIELSKEHQEAENKMVSPKEIVKENETGALETESPSLRVVDRGESPEEPGSGGKARDASGGSCKAKKLDRFVRQDSPQAEEPLYEFSDPENEPNWQQLFANGVDDREHVLLEEYTANLRKYKEIRKELSEVRMKNNDNQQETMLQLKELRSAIAMKDEEIQSLHQKLRFIEESESSQQDRTQDMPAEGLKCQSCSGPILHQNAEATARPDASTTDRATEFPPNGVKDEEKTKVLPVGQNRAVSAAEAKFRKDIDGLLEENLDFWMRFSGLFHQIQQLQTTAHDLQGEYAKLKKRSSQEDSTTSKHVHSLKSDARPIYNHLREIQTDLTVWIEQNMLLKDESKDRLASLCSIQEEIERVSKMDPGTDAEFTTYQAAKFQGEVSNMQQENKKVADELQLGLEHVKELRVEIEKTLTQIDEELNFSGSKNHQHHVAHSLSRTRIPLQSFLFGVKAKKQKPSFLACINPALQRRHREMQSHFPL